MLVFNFGLDSLCIAAFDIFQDFLPLIASSSESSKGSVTPLLVIEMVVMVMVSYGYRTFRHEPGLAIFAIFSRSGLNFPYLKYPIQK